jgi:hypothetical protein
MYHQKKIIRKTLLTVSLFAVALTGCKKDNNTDIHSPAYHINQSEELIIPATVDLPANLPAGNSRVATFYAEGVQKYKAQVKAGSNPVIYEWVFLGPQANLFDAFNKKTGTHGTGPFWELSPNDSLFAQHFSPAKTAPGNDANSIDWLLLMPKAGKTPTGLFANIAYIQRIATMGGKAPTAPPMSLGSTAEVNYTAIYRFSKKNP